MSKGILLFLCVALTNVPVFGNTGYVNIEEYPYHVSIQEHRRHVCSGAFVHESWIITAASCFIGVELSAVSVRVRTSTISMGGDELEVGNIIVHPEFDRHVYHNNIALVKLKVPAQFGEKLLPIGLPNRENYVPDDGTMCFVTGWRHNQEGPVEPRLTVTAVPVVNLDTCASVMPGYGPVSEKMVCAGNLSHGVETCQGDPGAPLMEDQTLIAILSYGLGCKTMIHPGIYTRISSYLPWISASSGISYM